MEELDQGEAVEETTEEDVELSESSPEETEEAEETAEDAGAGQGKNAVQKRIGQLTRKQREAERERDYWRQMAMQNQSQQQAPTQPTQDVRPQRPTLEQFEFDDSAYNRALDKYEDELTDWKFRQNWTQHQKQEEKRKEEERNHYRNLTLQQKTDELFEKGAVRHEDFEDVVRAIPVTIMDAAMAEAVLSTDNSDSVAYYLGKNLEEASKIAQMSPIARGVALGRLDAAMSVPKKKTTSAPPPPSKLAGQHVGVIDIDKLPPKEFARLRNEGKI